MNPLDALSRRLQRLRLGDVAGAVARALSLYQGKKEVAAFAAAFLEEVAHGRESKCLARRIERTQLEHPSADLVDYWGQHLGRGITVSQLQALGGCRWVEDGRNLVVTGKPGTGKSWLASALGNAALRKGHAVRFWAVPDVLAAWYEANADGTVGAFRRGLDRAGVLILDDWGMESLMPEDAPVLRRILAGRLRQTKSVLIASVIPVSSWTQWLGDDNMGESMTAKILAPAVVLEFRKVVKPPP